ARWAGSRVRHAPTINTLHRRGNTMAAGKQLSGAGLRGQVAGKTALSTVGKSGSGLTYRGYDVKDLAENCQFEEVAYLILKGKLPNQAELDAYKGKLKKLDRKSTRLNSSHVKISYAVF